MKDAQGSKKWCSIQKTTILYDESSLRSRRNRVKGSNSLKGVEEVYTITKGALSLPPAKRKHYPGSNASDGLAFVEMMPWSSTLCMPFQQKKRILGKSRVPVGGASDKVDGSEPEEEEEDADGEDVPPPISGKGNPKSRADTNVEPLNYQSLPQKLFSELQHSWKLQKLVVDLSPSDGECAKAMLEKMTPYIGVCFCDEHAAVLYQHLTEYMLQRFSDEHDEKHYEPRFMAALGSTSKAEEGPEPKKPKVKESADPKESSDNESGESH